MVNAYAWPKRRIPVLQAARWLEHAGIEGVPRDSTSRGTPVTQPAKVQAAVSAWSRSSLPTLIRYVPGAATHELVAVW